MPILTLKLALSPFLPGRIPKLDPVAASFNPRFPEKRGSFESRVHSFLLEISGIREPSATMPSSSPVKPAMIPPEPLSVFISYAHRDEDLKDELVAHLATLKRLGKITAWDDRNIEAGVEWDRAIQQALEEAQIVLMLITPHFMASDYCYDQEMKRALERHDEGTARVIPIIIKPVDWQGTPFSRLSCLPKDGKPVTQWSDRDEAFLDVVQEIRRAVESLQATKAQGSVPSAPFRDGVNPFNYGTSVPPEGFYGRTVAIMEVKNRIGAITAQSVNVVGLRRIGKTSFLHYIRGRSAVFFQPSQRPLIILLDLQDQRFHTPEGLLEGVRRSLTRVTGQEPWNVEENQDSWAVEDGLLNLRKRGDRLIVLLDEFEAIGQHLQAFQGWGDDWRSKACAGLLTLVIASKTPISEIYQDFNLTSPFGNIFSTTILGALEPEAWRQLVRDGFRTEKVSESTWQWLDALAGGFPFYVQMAATLLWQWGDEQKAAQEFRFQAKPRLEELWRGLSTPEQAAIRGLVMENRSLSGGMLDRLQRYGIVRSNGELFSPILGEIEALSVRRQPQAVSRVNQLRRDRLERELDQLTEEYQAVSDQLSTNLNPSDRVRLERQLEQLETRMKAIEAEL